MRCVGRARGLLFAVALGAAASAGAGACASGEGGPFQWGRPDGLPTPALRTDDFTWSRGGGASVLFVVDASADACGLQQDLRAGVPAFVDGLATLVPDVAVRIGVTTSDVSDPALTGALLDGPAEAGAVACEAATHPVCDDLAHLPLTVVTDETPSPARTLACLMDVPTATESDPFAAAAAALAPDRLNESGLFVTGSVIAVVIVSADAATGCAAPLPGESPFLCEPILSGDPLVLADVAGATDFLVARIPAPEEEGTEGVAVNEGASGPVIDPDEKGKSPVCNLPDGVERTATDGDATTAGCGDAGLAAALYGVARDLASVLVPGCLQSPPCPGIGADDIYVGVLAGGLPMADEELLVPFEDYSLVPDPTCSGGYRVEFNEEPAVGDQVTIAYPTGTC